MHYCKGNPSKIPYIIHTFALFDPPKMGILMIPVWTKTHQLSQSAIGDCVAHHRARQVCWNNTIEVFQFSNTEREIAEKGKTLRFHVKLQRCMNHPIETKTANWIVSPYLAVNTNLWKKTLGQVLMVYRFQINFLLTGKTIGYPWGIHHDVYMFVKRCNWI